MPTATIDSGDFGVSVVAWNVKKVHQDGHLYIALQHNSEYSIQLSNRSGSRCDASVTIDGRSVGKFRVPPFDTITIERPSSQSRKFVFLQEDSGDAHRAGIVNGHSANGAVSVVFYPERQNVVLQLERGYRQRSFDLCTNATLGMENNCKSYGMSSGATALGDHSSQSFSSTSAITGIDHNRTRTIAFRMVVDDIYRGQVHVVDDFPVMDCMDRHRTTPAPIKHSSDWHSCNPWCTCRSHSVMPPRVDDYDMM